MADTSSIGAAPAATDVESTVSVDWAGPYSETGEVTVDTGQAANAVAARLPMLRVEVWPARVAGGTMLFGSAPLVTQGAVTEPVTTLHYSLPRLRNPVTTTTFVIGIAPDGRRVVLGANLDLTRTPPWTGTLVEWWTGN